MIDHNMKSDFAIIVPSYDGAEKMWHPFFTLLFKYWPDCKYPIYLITNNEEYPDDRVKCIMTGEDINWSRNLENALIQIPEQNIILLLDDFFITGPIRTQVFEDIVEQYVSKKAAYVELMPLSKLGNQIRKKNKSSLLSSIPKGMPYRVNLQASIWNRSTLSRLLKNSTSIWNFEMVNSKLSCYSDEDYCCLTKNDDIPIKYINACVRGKLTKEAIDLLKNENIDMNIKDYKIRRWYEGDTYHMIKVTNDYFLDYFLRAFGRVRY